MKPVRYAIYAAASDWQKDIKPTHHLRVSLCQSISFEPLSGKTWVRGDEVIYERVYEQFVRSLSKRLAPNLNVWKRFKPILPNVGCLHGARGNTSWHFHINLRVPEGIDEETLKREIYLTAHKDRWIPNGPDYVDLSPIRSGGGAISYTMKEGFDHVMIV